MHSLAVVAFFKVAFFTSVPISYVRRVTLVTGAVPTVKCVNLSVASRCIPLHPVYASSWVFSVTTLPTAHPLLDLLSNALAVGGLRRAQSFVRSFVDHSTLTGCEMHLLPPFCALIAMFSRFLIRR
jgi:hypothetical protein